MCPATWPLLSIALLMTTAIHAQETDGATSTSETRTVSPLRKLLDESLTWDELLTSEEATEPMTLRVVMRWANPPRGSGDGMTVLYLSEGRPEAVCCVYRWGRKLTHEFDSLSRGTLIARRDGAVVWRPATPGPQFKPIRGADAPADSPAARLRQMKTLAGQFSSTMLGWRANKSDREELRLLPQPLYRYDSRRSDILDGAVFAFVQGTDPESLLLLEAFQAADGFEWQFGFARRTSGRLEGRHQGTIVWQVPGFPQHKDPLRTHIRLRREIDPNVLQDLEKK